jgi:hypothetical protein
MNTLHPELIKEEDEATFSSNLFKLYKLDERCNKLEAPSFRILFLRDKKTQIHVSNHFNSASCIITYYDIKSKKCIDARMISKALYNKIYDHYFKITKTSY